jgi:hypothetical protein
MMKEADGCKDSKISFWEFPIVVHLLSQKVFTSFPFAHLVLSYIFSILTVSFYEYCDSTVA